MVMLCESKGRLEKIALFKQLNYVILAILLGMFENRSI